MGDKYINNYIKLLLNIKLTPQNSFSIFINVLSNQIQIDISPK